jgi:hypothetical protein
VDAHVDPAVVVPDVCFWVPYFNLPRNTVPFLLNRKSYLKDSLKIHCDLFYLFELSY